MRRRTLLGASLGLALPAPRILRAAGDDHPVASGGPSLRAASGPPLRAASGPPLRAASGPSLRAASGPSLRAASGPSLRAASGPSLRAASGDPVDLLLVLAADVSRSMDEDDLRLQRQGYAAALRHPRVVEAIVSGPQAAIGLAYLEWSGIEQQRTIVAWARLDGYAAAEGFARELEAAPILVGSWTSISAALAASRRLIAAAPFAAERRVIDVSGDGVNNNGPPVEPERDQAVAEGITINGLPILRKAGTPQPGWTPQQALEEHYREDVTGGFGAFVLPAEGLDSFGAAIRRKLVLEIAAAGAPGGPT